ncbi:hypothetical protein SAMN04487949_3169 [Halogranum gelatinilyticum]|uniref:Uncharacterized protein n=1 Tax=Halogranum gelatinilyticum TaxID=660521 RepID=A0A1G9XYY9_9EURY|nr:DUF5810 domain-containing protein [Halogranum gelatinilyticum]SDN01473.1 hypothetical protein SAMN04487949_3169 [Halogranum gelatinilyticum]
MGYACPVCDVPQRDGKHLANHLAFTAMLRHEEHEDWLDEHVDGWQDMNAPALADVVVDHAEEQEFDELFEDTVDGESHAHPQGHGHGHGHGQSSPAIRTEGEFGSETQEVLQEARELTQQMVGDADEVAEAVREREAAAEESERDEETTEE